MSERDIDTFQRAVAAWNQGDCEGWVACFDPEAEWMPGLSQVDGGRPIVGHDSIREAWEDLQEAYEMLAPEYDEVSDTGEAILALGRLLGRSATGVPINIEYGVVARYRDGLAVSVRSFPSHVEAREAAGTAP